MWPKILIELVPHIARLVPMADKFFSSRSANDDATQQAIAALRTDLAQTASTHAALYRQMNEQSERIAEAANDARATRDTIASLDARLTGIEQSNRRVSVAIVALACLNLALLGGVLALLLRH